MNASSPLAELVVQPDDRSVTDLKSAVVAARAAATRGGQVVTVKQASKATLLADLALRVADLGLLEQAAASDSVRKVLDGDETPLDAKRQQRIERQREKIAAIEAALPVADQRTAVAALAYEEADQAFRDAVLALCSALQASEITALRNGLAALAPAIARLIGIDQVIAEIVGAKFSFDPSRHGTLLSGDKVARKLLAGLPDRLRPPELATAAVNGEAVEIAANLISQLQGA